MPDPDPTGSRMPALLRSAGFDTDGGKVQVGAGTKVFSGPETRKWLAWRAEGQLREGDPFRQSWLDASITEDEIQETLRAVRKWAEMEDAFGGGFEDRAASIDEFLVSADHVAHCSGLRATRSSAYWRVDYADASA